MDQESGTGGVGNTGRGYGSEDASEARDHVRAAEENRDALEAQNRRTEATAPDRVNTPVGDQGGTSASSGSSTSGTPSSSGTTYDASGSPRPSEDASQAREHVRAAEENRDALADENRRVEHTTPPGVDTGR